MLGPLKDAINTRIKHGLSALVLIDNLNYSTRYWYRIANEFAGKQVSFLISSREEDWFRYGQHTSGFTLEITRPQLSLEEAKAIFSQLEERGKIASGVTSAEWAFEKVQDRKLLMEFVYLVTHGKMLEERLSDQIAEMDRLGEDQGKIEFLRLVSTAQVYGAYPRIADILQQVSFTKDARNILGSLENEYIMMEGDRCTGLHRVRSEHLVRLLHGHGYPKIHTVLKLIDCLDSVDIGGFLANAFADTLLDANTMVEKLMENYASASLETINRLTDALFMASETAYFYENKGKFDEAFRIAGPSGVLNLGYSRLPASSYNFLAEQNKILGEKHEAIRRLFELSQELPARDIKKRFERMFLVRLLTEISSEQLLAEFGELEPFISWCRIAEVETDSLQAAFAKTQWREEIFHANLQQVGSFLAGLYQYSQDQYNRFFEESKDKLFGYYKYLTDTLLLEERNSGIYIEFIADPDGNSKQLNEQATERLQSLRLFFPFYEKYCSQGLYVYPLPSGAHDDTVKEAPKEMLYLKSDQRRNSSWLQLCEQHYKADSFYQWQEQWSKLRSDWLDCARKLINTYATIYRGGKIRQKDNDAIDSLARETLHNTQHARKLPEGLFGRDISSLMRKIDSVSSAITNFLSQFYQHDPEDAKQRFSHLMRHNLKDAIKRLPEAHNAFEELLSECQDYFNMSRLDTEELETYQYLADILDYWFEVPYQRIGRLRDAVRRHKEATNRRFRLAVKDTMKPLEEAGMMFYYPNEPLIDHPFTYLCIGLNVCDFRELQKNYLEIILRISRINENYDFLFMAPLINGQRYTPVVLQISKDNVDRIAGFSIGGNELILLPVVPPPGMFDVLPEIEQISLPELDVLENFAAIHNVMEFLSKRRSLSESRLDDSNPFERKLLETYKKEYDSKMEHIRSQRVQLNREVAKIEAKNPAAEEWRIFCSAINNEFGKNIRPLSEVLVDAKFDRAFSVYMNKRYLQESS